MLPFMMRYNKSKNEVQQEKTLEGYLGDVVHENVRGVFLEREGGLKEEEVDLCDVLDAVFRELVGNAKSLIWGGESLGG